MASELRNFRAEGSGDDWDVVADNTGQGTIYLKGKVYLTMGDLTEAQARGMAAWEDLLEALKDILPLAVNTGPSGCDGKTAGCPKCEAIKSARKAIAKATPRPMSNVLTALLSQSGEK
jgi:hypothetical protein